MQYRAHDSSPDSFNILSGEKASMSTFANYMERMSPSGGGSGSTSDGNGDGDDHVLVEQDIIRPPLSDLAWKYLKFDPKYNLKSGIAQLLAWHLNRHLPYGQWTPTVPDDKNSTTSNIISNSNKNNNSNISTKSRTESGYQFLKRMEIPLPCKDDENRCLRGYRIFPCASECSDESMCRTSGFDTAKSISQRWTKDCSNNVVVYTSSFGSDVTSIGIKAPKNHCAIAFISKDSKLMKEMVKGSNKDYEG